jgi:2'-5' RNA ligase
VNETARLFFAAWPAPEVQLALHGVARQALRESGGRAIAARNIHLTLAFLGDIERALVQELETVAAGISVPQCELLIDRVEYWRHNRILWAGVERCPDPVHALVAGLSNGLRALGLKLDDRPYVPHVTLLRNARRAPAALVVPVIAWPVHDFALIESVQCGRERVYEVMRRWPLFKNA